MSQTKPNGQSGPIQNMFEALRLSETGDKSASTQTLKNALATPGLETRLQLWIWNGLRELGVQPDSKSGYEVLGIIIEFPSGTGYDTLAFYADGSARYLNFSGKAIFWDLEDAKIKDLGQALINATLPISQRALPRTSLTLPQRGGQVTLLTRSGLFAIKDPPNSVINAGAALMIEMMKRAREKSG